MNESNCDLVFPPMCFPQHRLTVQEGMFNLTQLMKKVNQDILGGTLETFFLKCHYGVMETKLIFKFILLMFFCRLLTRSKARLALYSPYTWEM